MDTPTHTYIPYNNIEMLNKSGKNEAKNDSLNLSMKLWTPSQYEHAQNLPESELQSLWEPNYWPSGKLHVLWKPE